MHAVTGGGLRLVVDPVNGGRIVSIRHDGHEWLAPSFPAPLGSTRFTHRGTGGWDEMVPTIAAGHELPDHGDLWSIEWTEQPSEGNAVSVTARSASSDVTLRRLIVATPDGIELRYRASTDSADERRFLWSAHPLVAAEPGTTVHLPGVHSLVEEYPEPGRIRDVPSSAWLEELGSRRVGVKAFVRADGLTLGEDGWVSATVSRRDGRALRFSWMPGEIPWLGVYWDSGEFSDRPVLALEPTSANTDHADRAVLWAVRRGRPRSWRLRLSPTNAAQTAMR